MSAEPPPPSAREPPDGSQTRDQARLVLTILLVAAGVFLLIQVIGGSGGSSHTVTYTVTGGPNASITYETGSQDGTQETDAVTPWIATATMSGGDLYYVSAQNQGPGAIACSVQIDGTQADTDSSSGPTAICTASGHV